MSTPNQLDIKPVGEFALTVEFDAVIHPDINAQVYALEHILLDSALPGIIETVPCYHSLLIYFDPFSISESHLRKEIEERVARLDHRVNRNTRIIEVPTLYGGECGPDLAFVADHNGLSEAEVIHRHSSRIYPIYMMGFTPGFPYLGEMDPRIAAPRLGTPRVLIPAGSVGIAGEQTGIYSIDSPGGWRIIGRTPLQLFDPRRENPFLFAPGDRIQFVPIDQGEWANDS
ncbi:MAG: 5-oxoprolinase subunit PxpB [Anaerolineaceae bacterium]|nr:5-oxoprolinase subunit PxpB [Anaerolineaceae bacterium]